MRFPLTWWRWLFAPTPRPFDLGQYPDAGLARGAYFSKVEGMGHCRSATPAGLDAAAKGKVPKDSPAYLSGAVVERFFAPSLRSDEPGRSPAGTSLTSRHS